MVFRDNIMYKNDNTLSKNHLILISNMSLHNQYIPWMCKSQGKSVIDERNVCVTIYIIIRKDMKIYENTD